MDNKELNFCEKEQLHLSGKVQSFGGLIGINKQTLIINHVSENIAEFCSITAEQMLGKNLCDISQFLAEKIKTLELNDKSKFDTQIVDLFDNKLSIRFSEDATNFILDIEPYQKAELVVIDESAKKVLALTPKNKMELQQFYQNFVEVIKSLIDFDRVMIYQFQEDWSGVVVAEASQSKLGSYLDLRWPASDIPKIARKLYEKNPSRVICDVHDPQVNILSNSDEMIDLTYSETRSVSPVHLEYLSNMGVSASFSISIMNNNKLWGLVACHHTNAKTLDAITKQEAIKITDQFSQGLKAYFMNLKMYDFEHRQIFINKLVNLVSAENLFEVLQQNQMDLMNYVEADGFAIQINNQILSMGNTPSPTYLNGLIEYLENPDNENVLSTQSIYQQGVFDEYSGPPGVIAHFVANEDGKALKTFWFKDEVIQEVTWAGNPNKPMYEDGNAKKLVPRLSFEKWIEVKKNQSNPFGQFDEAAALQFSELMLKHASYH